jgi:hypothetical protein
MTELSSTHTEEDRIGDWFAAQLESGAMDLEGLPRRMARLGLMTPEQFLVEMGERMGSDLAEQKPLAVPGAQREFALDVYLRGALRVKATSLAAAREGACKSVDCATVNLGLWIDGTPIIAEVSMAENMPSRCFAVDGDEQHPGAQPKQAVTSY